MVPLFEFEVAPGKTESVQVEGNIQTTQWGNNKDILLERREEANKLNPYKGKRILRVSADEKGRVNNLRRLTLDETKGNCVLGRVN